MKKLMSLFLAMILALSICSAALADDPNEAPGTVTMPYSGIVFTPPASFQNAAGVISTDGDMELDDELFLFSGITGRRCYPQGNRKLSCLKEGVKTEDDFMHEQCLVITQNGKRWLLSGCAHNGILNILDRYKELFDSHPDYVITGFHMMKREGKHTEEEKAVIIQTAQELSQLDTVFYSGHCTGIPAFELMKEIMGDKLIALHSGETVI